MVKELRNFRELLYKTAVARTFPFLNTTEIEREIETFLRKSKEIKLLTKQKEPYYFYMRSFLIIPYPPYHPVYVFFCVVSSKGFVYCI